MKGINQLIKIGVAVSLSPPRAASFLECSPSAVASSPSERAVITSIPLRDPRA
jgi:hypothetical protein